MRLSGGYPKLVGAIGYHLTRLYNNDVREGVERTNQFQRGDVTAALAEILRAERYAIQVMKELPDSDSLGLPVDQLVQTLAVSEAPQDLEEVVSTLVSEGHDAAGVMSLIELSKDLYLTEQVGSGLRLRSELVRLFIAQSD